MHKNQVENDRRLNEKKKARGLKRVVEWIPADPAYRARMKAYAVRLVREYEKGKGGEQDVDSQQ